MSSDPAFLFYPGDYLRDTQCLSEKSQVAYDRIMCEHMRNISKDMSKIGVSQHTFNFLTKRLSEEEKEDICHILDKKDKIFHIKWVAESIAKRKSYTDSRSKNRSKKHMKTYDQHMENENENENKDKEKNKEEDKEKKKETEIKHRYGEYKHVLLTDKQYQKLCDDYGVIKLKKMIINLDEGIQQHGYKYKDHNLTLRKWEKGNNSDSKKFEFQKAAQGKYGDY